MTKPKSKKTKKTKQESDKNLQHSLDRVSARYPGKSRIPRLRTPTHQSKKGMHLSFFLCLFRRNGKLIRAQQETIKQLKLQVDSVGQRVERVDEKVGHVDERVEDVDKKVERVERTYGSKLEELAGKIADLDEDFLKAQKEHEVRRKGFLRKLQTTQDQQKELAADAKALAHNIKAQNACCDELAKITQTLAILALQYEKEKHHAQQLQDLAQRNRKLFDAEEYLCNRWKNIFTSGSAVNGGYAEGTVSGARKTLNLGLEMVSAFVPPIKVAGELGARVVAKAMAIVTREVRGKLGGRFASLRYAYKKHSHEREAINKLTRVCPDPNLLAGRLAFLFVLQYQFQLSAIENTEAFLEAGISRLLRYVYYAESLPQYRFVDLDKLALHLLRGMRMCQHKGSVLRHTSLGTPASDSKIAVAAAEKGKWYSTALWKSAPTAYDERTGRYVFYSTNTAITAPGQDKKNDGLASCRREKYGPRFGLDAEGMTSLSGAAKLAALAQIGRLNPVLWTNYCRSRRAFADRAARIEAQGRRQQSNIAQRRVVVARRP